jgi:hypothetical protein
MVLNAPYEEGRVFKTVEPSTFRILVTVLPESPIKSLTLTNEERVAGIDERLTTVPVGASELGGGWNLNSKASCRNEGDRHKIEPDPGGEAGNWAIVPSSIQVVYSSRDVPSRARASVEAATATGFAVKGRTIANCTLGISYDSGAMTYFVRYLQVRPTVTVANSSVPVVLAHWGDEISLTVTPGRWKIQAVLWDGSVHEWTETNDNRYLRVIDQRDQIQVKALSPSDIMRP